MRKVLLSTALILGFFLTACELKDVESDKEKCQKRQRETAILSIAQCGLRYTAGTSDYNLCVDLCLIAFMDHSERCEK